MESNAGHRHEWVMDEYKLYLELKELYGEYETEEEFWENQKTTTENLIQDVPF